MKVEKWLWHTETINCGDNNFDIVEPDLQQENSENVDIHYTIGLTSYETIAQRTIMEVQCSTP